ncbi:MAG: RNA polymerase sigma factor [Verrucomicrobiaceae bacterium]|nr:RNA polymerase sigma factor [Verrucomicrobiaceae bacterium]
MTPSATTTPSEFEQLVDAHYQGLYRFALSLSQRTSEAEDLTQQTFMRWAEKGHQLRERHKAKTWLYTTLYREFLGGHRRTVRFPHSDLEEAEHELPAIEPDTVLALDGKAVITALGGLDENFKVPLTLFYLQDHSYQEIAEILDVPIGTVMSRLSRGKDQLRARLADRASASKGKGNVIEFQTAARRMNHG